MCRVHQRSVAGTPAFMSLEAVLGEQNVGPDGVWPTRAAKDNHSHELSDWTTVKCGETLVVFDNPPPFPS